MPFITQLYMQASRRVRSDHNYALSKMLATSHINKLLLVGEDNPGARSQVHALTPGRQRSAGHRLCTKILGMYTDDYMATWRTNLCLSRWHMPQAQHHARDIYTAYAPPWSTVVCFGRKVATAFTSVLGVTMAPFTAYTRGAVTYISLPHPSGRVCLWNTPVNVENARVLINAYDSTARLGVV